MTIVLNGTTGLSGVDGSAGTPALQGNDSNTGISFGTDTVTINTGGTVRVTTDSSGNLGLGVTPSAWNSDFRVLQFGAMGGLWNYGTSGNNTSLGSNIYYDASLTTRYLTNGSSTRYQHFNGSHIWFTAPSGTAGNAITFTQAMTLTAGGNLLVGTSVDTTNGRVHIAGASATTNGVNISYAGVGAALIRITDDRSLTFGLDNASGNTERARIDSSGNLLVGTTGGGIPTQGFALAGTSGGYSVINIGHASGTPGGYGYAAFGYDGSTIGSIGQNGTTGVSYNTTSDYRLKENVQPMTGALAKVAQLKPCTYTWKADGSAGQGFIAHELQAVVPDAVTGEKDAVDEDGKPKYQGVDTSFLVATLVSAIQEQQTIIQNLTARLEALENK